MVQSIHKSLPTVHFLSQLDPVQHSQHPTSWKYILIFNSHLRLGLPSGLCPSGFPTNTLYMPLLSIIRPTCPAHLILVDFITTKISGEENRSLSSSLCSFLHSPVSSSLLGPCILLRNLIYLFIHNTHSRMPYVKILPDILSISFLTSTDTRISLWHWDGDLRFR